MAENTFTRGYAWGRQKAAGRTCGGGSTGTARSASGVIQPVSSRGSDKDLPHHARRLPSAGGAPEPRRSSAPGYTGVDRWLNTTDHMAYLNGYGTGLFGPDDHMTRAQAAQMFYNLLLTCRPLRGAW